MKKISIITTEKLDELIIEKKSHIANLMNIHSLIYYLKIISQIWIEYNLVQKSLYHMNPEGILAYQNHHLVRHIFHSRGLNEILSCDSHNKLFQWEFGIYGDIDVFSQYMIWFHIGISNSDSRVILFYFLNFLNEYSDSDDDMMFLLLVFTISLINF